MPYSSTHLFGSMLMAQMFSATGTISWTIGAVPNIVERRSFAWHMAMRTRFPFAARARASAAHTVVFPTPPLPVTMRKRREASGVIRHAQ
jgi:hypothetical protein